MRPLFAGVVLMGLLADCSGRVRLAEPCLCLVKYEDRVLPSRVYRTNVGGRGATVPEWLAEFECMMVELGRDEVRDVDSTEFDCGCICPL
jgi:hypothetical protein